MVTINGYADRGANRPHSQAKSVATTAICAEARGRTSGVVIFDDIEERERVVAFLADYHSVQGYSSSDRGQIEGHLADSACRFVLLAGVDHALNLDILSWIRCRSNTPTIIMGSSCEQECVAALDRGADDYIVAPGSLRELLARIRVILFRRPATKVLRKAERYRYIFGDWEYDERLQRLINHKDFRIPVTRRECALLSAFLRSPQRILSRDYLIRIQRNCAISPRAIDT